MAVSDSLENHFRDQLEPIGGVSSRRMFGAACLFVDGVAFAIIDNGSLFLKTDEALKAALKAAGGVPFTYEHKKKGSVEMSYCSPPESAFDDVKELLGWARKSAAIARAGKSKPAKKAAKTVAKKTTKKVAKKVTKKAARKA
ncbi:MAG: TfoX/Sxy family protein [Deltaproteobacteria bacterium]|nr:TfoX/Sxy family protein [Deltaproteobacteria bacterium]